MSRVCAVIHVKGFPIQSRGGFHVRELGYCDWTRKHFGSYRYRLPWRLKDLSSEESRIASNVTRKVHGLPLRALLREQPRPEDAVCEDIRRLYDCHRTPERDLVGYNGGRAERDLLQFLGIPSYDLELDGCPPFERLERLQGVEGCGNHRNPLGHRCAQIECVHFVNWMRRQAGLSFQTGCKYEWEGDQYRMLLPTAHSAMEPLEDYTHPGFGLAFQQRLEEATNKTNELLAAVEELNEQRLLWQWRCDALLDRVLCRACKEDKDGAYQTGGGLSWLPNCSGCEAAYCALDRPTKKANWPERPQYADSDWHAIKALQEVRDVIYRDYGDEAVLPRAADGHSTS